MEVSIERLAEKDKEIHRLQHELTRCQNRYKALEEKVAKLEEELDLERHDRGAGPRRTG